MASGWEFGVGVPGCQISKTFDLKFATLSLSATVGDSDWRARLDIETVLLNSISL